MRKTDLLREIRKMSFEEYFSIWTGVCITQAAQMLNVLSRTFRRYIDRHHNNALMDCLINA